MSNNACLPPILKAIPYQIKNVSSNYTSSFCLFRTILCSFEQWLTECALQNVFAITLKAKNTLMLIKVQPDATVCRYLFTSKSLYMFRVSQHPSSGWLKTVTTASGTGHNIGTATCPPTWLDVATLGVAVTVFSTPDDGCCDTRNM